VVTTLRIDFFEEFPTDENLQKAALVDFKSTVFLAARSMQEFREAQRRLKRVNPSLEAAYWPLLPRSYWISPFSSTPELKHLIEELRETGGLEVLIDLELPFLSPKLFLVNLPRFFQNKRLIGEILAESGRLGVRICTAEYALPLGAEELLKWAGVSYSLQRFPHTRLIMFYTSMMPPMLRGMLEDTIIRNSRRWGKRFGVGLGTIARGILGTEPILTPGELERDLRFLERVGVGRAVIFRLGGLDEEYSKILRRYAMGQGGEG